MSDVQPIKTLSTDALTGLRAVGDGTVQVALTSPPFYLLRRYGASALWPDGWHGELGHESHPNHFVRHLLDVFDQVWRTLKDDGCLWVNLADTYNNRQGKRGTTNAPDGSNGRFAAGGRGYADSLRSQPEFFKHYIPGIGHKSELGVPFRFHLAMTDPDFRRFVGASEGPNWICRRTIIWAKSLVRIESQAAEGNAMPEPTLDRPSRNYEFLFLFTKQPHYRFDRTRIDVPARSSQRSGDRTNAGSVWETGPDETLEFECTEPPGGINGSVGATGPADGSNATDAVPDALWRVNSEASPYRHVAMWPRSLVRQMLLPTTQPGDTVLDPFAGSGTTAEVAADLGLQPIMIEAAGEAQAAMAHRLLALNGNLLV